MTHFSTSEVARVAALAHIALTDDEIEQIATDLAVIDQSVAKVSEVVDESTPSTSHPIPLTNVTRPDVIGPTLDRDEVLNAAPDAQDGQFRVPQILGEE